MDQGDIGSQGSSDSINTNEEFEIVCPNEPELRIGGNGSIEDLKQSLQEVLMDGSGSLVGNKLHTNKASKSLQPKLPLNHKISQPYASDRDSLNKEKMPTSLENKCRSDSMDVGGNDSSETTSCPADEMKGIKLSTLKSYFYITIIKKKIKTTF